jgi:hypothetical protein
MAAPGTPNAVVMPSFSSTAMAASTALIFGMSVSNTIQNNGWDLFWV